MWDYIVLAIAFFFLGVIAENTALRKKGMLKDIKWHADEQKKAAEAEA